MQRSGKTIAEIAADYGVTAQAIDYGLAWCRKQRIGNRQDKAELEKRIADVQHDIKRLESEIRRVRRDMRQLTPDQTGYSALNNSLIGFHREVREHKRDLAELEGLLKRVVELDVPGLEEFVSVLRNGVERGPMLPGNPDENHDGDSPAAG